MEHSPIERWALPVSAAAWRAALAGAVAGAAATCGVALLAFAAASMLAGAVGVVGTAIAALLVGLWVGAPVRGAAAVPLRARWVSAALASALAGTTATAWTLMGPLAQSAPGRVAALLAVVAAPVYAVGVLVPSTVARSEADADPPDEDRGAGWGAVGDAVAGFIGGLGMGMALTALFLYPWLGAGPVLLTAALFLLLPLLRGETPAGEPREVLLHEVDTPFWTLRVTEVAYPGERQPERRLYLNDEQESGELVRSGAPTLAYIAAAESWLARDVEPGRRYLFLGGGAYTLPRRIAERDPRAQLTVVELDPEVTRAAYRYFGVGREHRIHTVHGDARAFLDRAPAGRFDRIYVDVYGGEGVVPFPLVSREGLEGVKARLAEGGEAGFNLIGVVTGGESTRLWSAVRTATAVFPSLAVYTYLGRDYPEPQNVLMVAASEPGHDLPERAGLLERWPAHSWPEVPTSVLRDLTPTSAVRDGAAASASLPGSGG